MVNNHRKGKRVMHTRLAVAVAALTAVLGVAGCGGDDSTSSGGGSSDGGSITIGSIHDLSGPIAPYGESLLNGTKLAFDQVNADGGVLGGRTLELVSEDSASDKATMPSLMRKLGGEDPAAIIGPTSSSALTVGAPVAKQLETVLIAPSSSDNLQGILNEWTFRVAPVEAVAFTDLFKEMQAEAGGFKRVALFYDDANNASITERKLLEENQKALGYELVAVEASPEGKTDVSSAVSKITAANPDAIFISHLVPESAAFMKQVRARGIDTPFVGGAPFATLKIFEVAGKAGEGALTFVPYLGNTDDPQIAEFSAAYEKAYGSTPDQFAALGYDAAKVVIAAIEAAKSDDATAIRDAMAKLENIDGVAGSVSYDGGPENVTPELKLVRVQDGKFVPVSES
jgi:branched-chain amino acid transport system substrate-binding protein